MSWFRQVYAWYRKQWSDDLIINKKINGNNNKLAFAA